jgi:hypothetical protein
VLIAACGEHDTDVGAGGVTFQHAVADEHQSVMRLKR